MPTPPDPGGQPSASVGCRSCGRRALVAVLDLGLQPTATLEPRTGRAAEAPLRLVVCTACWLVQLPSGPAEAVDESELANLSATSTSLRADALAGIDELIGRAALADGATVLELASHGNHLHAELAARGLRPRLVEVDPGIAGRLEGVSWALAGAPLGRATAARIVAEHGPFDAVLDHYHAAHVAGLDDYLAGLGLVVRAGGVVCLEVDHAASTIGDCQFDAIRHGHYAYFSLTALQPALARHGLHVFDVSATSAFGGALRVYARRDPEATGGESRPTADRAVADVLAGERAVGLTELATYRRFAGEVERRAAAVRAFLVEARSAGRTVVGYGAPSRATTLLTTAGIGTELLPLVVDRSPVKAGRRLAGSGIPIGPVDEVFARRPDYLLVLTWNLFDEVVDQLSDARSWGCRFVRPLPRLEVVA